MTKIYSLNSDVKFPDIENLDQHVSPSEPSAHVFFQNQAVEYPCV